MISIRRPLKKEIIAFSNPNSRNSREKMSIKLSLDKTKTCPITKLLHNGPSAYSNLIQLNNKEIGCLFEGGYKSPYEGIAFKKVLIKDLLLN